MDISLRWINQYLSPGNLTADEADELLTAAGFPLEEVRQLGSGDTFLDVEVTSNRGDCLSHVGLAREIAASASASTPRRLKLPPSKLPRGHGPVAEQLTLRNTTPEVCPRFTARVIKGVKVGPSPTWLAERLEAVGQRPINNIVDVTNYITFELGHPCHVFDLARLAGQTLEIRYARENEPLTTLDAKARKLRKTDLVVADAERAQSLAGVIGGQDSEVTGDTVDIVLEMATWDPVTVRTAARAHNIRTDASYRFERGVSPLEIPDAAARAAALILEVAGGELCDGMLDEGAPLPEPITVDMRPSRCEKLLGDTIPVAETIHALRALEISVDQIDDDTLRCEIPPFRGDLTREIDLIEEVARTRGLDAVPVAEMLALRIQPPQDEQRALREVGSVLTGLGFYETVTFSFVSPAAAQPFTPEGLSAINVDDDRRGAEPTLRPSVLPGLLACRRANQHAQADPPGGVRLYERSAAFAEKLGKGRPETDEHRRLALLMDVPGKSRKRSSDDLQTGVRQLRGVIESLARAMAGPDARLDLEPDAPPHTGFDPGACARVMLASGPDAPRRHIGWTGLIAPDVLKQYDLQIPVVAAELEIDALVHFYPPKSAVKPLAQFPSIERDLSLVLDERTGWAQVEKLVLDASPDKMESLAFVVVYRGEQVGKGKKSLTLRVRFRDDDRTLRHEEVDPQMDALVERFRKELSAEIRV
ncbi:MAG: phenylalanine--tRNA ligase subunit beta [Phycisphaerales bacterium]|nr:phenylalanine--tRNA ligase subunit beta [Phycisphaerales bacterium]